MERIHDGGMVAKSPPPPLLCGCIHMTVAAAAAVAATVPRSLRDVCVAGRPCLEGIPMTAPPLHRRAPHVSAAAGRIQPRHPLRRWRLTARPCVADEHPPGCSMCRMV